MKMANAIQKVELDDSNKSPSKIPSPWVHRWAVALTTMTFPLIWVGGLVTTYDAGMAVPDWPNTFGYNLLLYPMSTWLFGPFDLFVEHGHRLLGMLVGILAIGLVIAAHLGETRRWVVVWSWFVLLAVIAQGVLGGMRVLMDERTMAMIHGCTGPVFFCLATATAVLTSKWWRESPSSGKTRGIFGWLVLILGVAALCQLVIGAQLRHIQTWASPRSFVPLVHLHLTLAVVVTILCFWTGIKTRLPSMKSVVGLRGPTGILMLLILVQLGLGVGTWISNYALPWPELTGWLARYTIAAKGWVESWIITGHQATGSLILAFSTIIIFRTFRQRRLVP
jgi:heme a synthase